MWINLHELVCSGCSNQHPWHTYSPSAQTRLRSLPSAEEVRGPQPAGLGTLVVWTRGESDCAPGLMSPGNPDHSTGTHLGKKASGRLYQEQDLFPESYPCPCRKEWVRMNWLTPLLPLNPGPLHFSLLLFLSLFFSGHGHPHSPMC
jgi:hypothetical protein